jgi:hypothetical protein
MFFCFFENGEEGPGGGLKKSRKEKGGRHAREPDLWGTFTCQFKLE